MPSSEASGTRPSKILKCGIPYDEHSVSADQDVARSQDADRDEGW